MRSLTWLFLLLATPAIVTAATIHVPAEQPTIQAGILAAVDGDTVSVAPGTYSGDGNRDVTFGGRNIVVRAEEGMGSARIELEGSASDLHRGFLFVNGEDSTAMLEGFDFRYGYAGYGAPVSENGGAILIETGASPTIRECIFQNCYSTGVGGAIYAHGASINLIMCGFVMNHATDGAALYVSGGPRLRMSQCYLVFQNSAGVQTAVWIEGVADCEIRGTQLLHGGAYETSSNLRALNCASLRLINTQLRSSAGTGLLTDSCNVTLDSCRLAYNGPFIWPDTESPDSDSLAASWGMVRQPENVIAMPKAAAAHDLPPELAGGATLSSGLIQVTNCQFVANSSKVAAGGLRITADSAVVSNCLFQGNESTQDGGGLWLSALRGAVTDCEFIGDTSRYSGGGMYISGGVCRVSDCFFQGNKADDWGGGLAGFACSLVLNNSIFDRNQVVNERGSGLSLNDCSATVDQCTLVRNSGGLGGAMFSSAQGPSCSRMIVAYSPDGEGVYSTVNGRPEFTCSDIYGNVGGDWTGAIADQFETNGNFSAMPFFCDTVNGNFALTYQSPCAPQNNECGVTIGALEPACTCCWRRGNVDHSGVAGVGDVNISDVTYLIDFVWGDGAAPICLEEGNIDGDPAGEVNVSDLSFFVAYLFQNGTAPLPCE